MLPSFLRFRRKGELEKKGPTSRRQKNKGSDTATLKRGMPGGLGLITFIALMLIWASCCFNVIYRIYQRPDLVVGQRAPNNIYAKVDFEVIDKTQTEAKRNDAAAKVPNHYQLRDNKTHAIRRKRLRKLFTRLISVRKNEPKPISDPIGDPDSERYNKLLNDSLDNAQQAEVILRYLGGDEEEAVEVLARLSNERSASWLPVLTATDYERQRNSDYTLMYGRKAFGFSNVASSKKFAEVFLKQLAQRSMGPAPKAEDLALLEEIFEEIAIPDLVFDEKATTKRRKRDASLVPPVTISKREDAQLLVKGKKVTEADLAVIKAHSDKYDEVRKDGRNIFEIAEDTGVCFWILLAFFFYIFATLPEFARARKNVLLASVLTAMNVLLLWSSNYLVTEVLKEPPRFVMAAYPMAFTAILLTILFSPKVGISFGFLVVLLQGVLAGESAGFIITLGMVQSVTGALAVKSVRTRLQIARAMLYVPLVSIICMSLFLAVRHQDTQWESYFQCAWISFVSAGIMVILTNMLLPILEWAFGLLSDISLLELSDLNHPLLKRLSLEAPGTYTHTMMVATLAEHAAEAIGANTLLTRVMSYFHDIGKLSNPIYFTENSFGDNHHEDLSPKMSARIIHNHVKEGLAMAQKYKLKEPLKEAIATHHGKGLVYYFYHRAKTEKSLDGSGGEAEYRYPGPNPRSPEATIISLADSCEAASRSLEKPTPQKIDAMVEDIFKGKLLDGQMNDTVLSMGELKTVLESIKKTIRVMLHGRIAYPKNEELEKVQTAGFGARKREIENSRLANIRKEQERTAILDAPDTKQGEDSESDDSQPEAETDEDTSKTDSQPETKTDDSRESEPDRRPDDADNSQSDGTGNDATGDDGARP